MRKAIAFALISIEILLANAMVSRTPQAAVKTVAIATLMSHPALDDVQAGMRDELERRGWHEGKNIVFVTRNANQQMQVVSTIASDLAALNPDVIVAITTPMAQAIAKCLPHTELGEVDLAAYNALVGTLGSTDVSALEALPLQGTLRLTSPIGGRAFSIAGPDAEAISVGCPYPFASAEFAGEIAELYWMALLRDVPFIEYATHPLIDEARNDLARFPGLDLSNEIFVGLQPSITVFMAPYAGACSGPRVSQFLLQNFDMDGVSVAQPIPFPLPVCESEGIDFVTNYNEWLATQRGFPPGSTPGEPRMDPIPRYICNMRDMGWYANQIGVLSTYMKASFILLGLGRDALDNANPYKRSSSVSGLGAFDFTHLMTLIGNSTIGINSNFLKWHHRRLRPEAMSGRIHNLLVKRADYPVHTSLLGSTVLDKIFAYNAKVNARRNLGSPEGTYLLPCLFGMGAPTHPSFPAGHGSAAGLGITMLKAWFDEDFILPDSMTVKPSIDGTSLEPYKAGVDGPNLTIGGELNKLAYNITWGRNMSGVHYRSDAIAGNELGEEIALRLLSEQRSTYFEKFEGFTLKRFDGTQITI